MAEGKSRASVHTAGEGRTYCRSKNFHPSSTRIALMYISIFYQISAKTVRVTYIIIISLSAYNLLTNFARRNTALDIYFISQQFYNFARRRRIFRGYNLTYYLYYYYSQNIYHEYYSIGLYRAFHTDTTNVHF